jgi:hypothetical protein
MVARLIFLELFVVLGITAKRMEQAQAKLKQLEEKSCDMYEDEGQLGS